MTDQWIPVTKEDQSLERQRKYWELSSFIHHLDYMRYNHKDASPNEIINKYLDNKEYEAKAWKEVADWEAECYRRNQRLLRAIKSVKGKTFHKYLVQIIKDCDRVTDQMQIVNEPRGNQQEAECGRTIKWIWVDQWSVGTEGDSFEGYICVELKPGKYLQFSYSM